MFNLHSSLSIVQLSPISSLRALRIRFVAPQFSNLCFDRLICHKERLYSITQIPIVQFFCVHDANICCMSSRIIPHLYVRQNECREPVVMNIRVSHHFNQHVCAEVQKAKCAAKQGGIAKAAAAKSSQAKLVQPL